MKKTVNINLGGIPFIIDEDAYNHLYSYLNAIERHFSKSDGCDDIMSDIEYRICELFQERLKTRKIISKNDLEEVVKIMGRPEDFGAEAGYDENDSVPRSERVYIRTGKRLFRDGEHRMVAGVIAGLAAYFGIRHVLLFRILWVAFALSAGAGVVVYLLLWLLVPEAQTASDKLAMKGEPINVENIAKTIEEEIDDLSKKINDISNGLSRRRNKKDDSHSQFGKGYSF